MIIKYVISVSFLGKLVRLRNLKYEKWWTSFEDRKNHLYFSGPNEENQSNVPSLCSSFPFFL